VGEGEPGGQPGARRGAVGPGRQQRAVGVRNGQVTLDLAPLEAVAKQDLVARGLTVAGKIPIVHATVALFRSKNLVQAQKAYRLINGLKIVPPVVTLVLLGLGVFLARRPRRAHADPLRVPWRTPAPRWCGGSSLKG
jgi:hypothetical protein